MAAAVDAGTSAAAPVQPAVAAVPKQGTEAPINPVTNLDDAISDALASMPAPDAPAAETPAQEPVETSAEPVAPADPFSDASLATPEGIKAAQKELRSQRQQWLDRNTKIDRRERKFNEKLTAFKQERDAHTLTAQQVNADASALLRGDGKTVLETISRMTRRPVHEVYEAMSLAVMNMGKPGVPASPEVAALKERLDRQEAELKSERDAAKQREDQQKQNAWLGSQIQEINALLPKFKMVEAWATDDPQACLDKIFAEAVRITNDTGKIPSYESIIAAEDRKLLDRYTRAGGAPTGEAARAPATQVKPAQAQRPPGQTVTQAAARQPQSIRTMTDAEREAELANDPNLLSYLGF